MDIENMTQTNPLSKHYRQPALYIKLPSGGQYWAENALEIPVSGEIPVYPMTTKDEIALKTPDALMNGEGMVSVIQSCCPNIKDAWKMPAIDVDYVMIAIRIASYGPEMKFDAVCPKCEETNSYGQDLRAVLDGVSTPNYAPVMIGDLAFEFKPQEYFQLNAKNQMDFEEQRLLRTLEDNSVDEITKAQLLKENLNKMLEYGLRSLTFNTASITTPEGEKVADMEMILDFYRNADAKLIKAVREAIEKVQEPVQLRPFQLQCKCGNSFETKFEFDANNFFV